MQALVGLFCFSLLLATGTCLECEFCYGPNKDCTGRLELCNKDQDTCATILTETIVGKVSRFTVAKSCYQASECLRSSNEKGFVKVNVNIECSSPPALKMESEGGKALFQWSNELPDDQPRAEAFKRPELRSAVDPNPGGSRLRNGGVTEAITPPVQTDKPPVQTDKPPVQTDKPPAQTDKPPAQTDKPPAQTDKPPAQTDKPPAQTDKPPAQTDKPPAQTDKPPAQTDKPPAQTDKPPVQTDKPAPETTKPAPGTTKPAPETTKPAPEATKPEQPKTTPVTETTTVGDAHQTVASFLLALSSLLLMNVLL